MKAVVRGGAEMGLRQQGDESIEEVGGRIVCYGGVGGGHDGCDCPLLATRL